MLLGAKRRLEQNVTHSHLPDLFLLLNEWFAMVPVKYHQQELDSQLQEWNRERNSLFCMVLPWKQTGLGAKESFASCIHALVNQYMAHICLFKSYLYVISFCSFNYNNVILVYELNLQTLV